MEGASFCFPPAWCLTKALAFQSQTTPSFELSWVIATSVPTEFHALPIEKAQISSP